MRVAARKLDVINLIGSPDTLPAIRVWLDDKCVEPPRDKSEAGRRARGTVVVQVEEVEDEVSA
jgi:hypothetical protein